MSIFRKIQQKFKNASPRRLESVPAYALWAKQYPATAHNPLMEVEQETMLGMLPDIQGKRVLDLACGTGRYGVLAAQHGASHVIGMDNSPDMLLAAEIQQVALSTTEQIPLANQSVDSVLCGLALGHLPQIAPSLAEISRVLKPNGIALISDFHPYQYLQGARRIFQGSDGKHYEVEHHLHLLSEYFQQALAVQLSMVDVQEPSLIGDAPVVFVMKFQKEGH